MILGDFSFFALILGFILGGKCAKKCYKIGVKLYNKHKKPFKMPAYFERPELEKR